MSTKERIKRYYFLGIGGVSMSALAIILKKQGNIVSGYDSTPSRATKMLEDEKIKVDFHENMEEILKSDVVVCSSAIKQDNPIFILVKNLKKRVLTRGQLLGQIASGYEKVIAVAGSHGKTTTTALIYEILSCAGFSPTLHLGGFRISDGKNLEVGEKEFFVTEACEYFDNFLNLHPYISVVTNVEKEHMDYFKTFERQLRSFEKFKSQSSYVIENLEEYKAKYIRHDKNGNLRFSIFNGKTKVMSLKLKICEEINTQNCIYAYQVAKLLGISDEIIKMGLERFEGVSTRFERVKCVDFSNCICDYAHHPTELAKAIKSAQKIYKNRLLVTIFQPHTYSRTKSLLDEFVKVFENLPLPLFYQTYSAREKEDEGVSAQQFTKILQKKNKNALYFDDFSSLYGFLQTIKDQNPVLLFLGAGDLPNILHKNNFIT
ncbi:MAG: UDP-N-acetylmuramate--L-alanine ligase [Candidatus Caccovivens sp.]